MPLLTISEAAERLGALDDLLLLTHRRPDGDTLGSAACLCRGLRTLGKTVYLAENPEVTPRYAWLVEGLTAPAEFVPRAVVSVDIAAADLVPTAQKDFLPRLTLVLDHHGGNSLACEDKCVVPQAGACGEVIYHVLTRLGVSLTRPAAEALYVAIATDTGCFEYSNTTAETHRVTAECLAAGADAGALNRPLFGIKSRARLAMESILIRNMRYEAGGRIALSVVSLADVAATGATDDDLDSIAALPRSIEGVDIGITLKETQDGCKVSVRTERSNAAAIAGCIGGGGHLRAAGAYRRGPLEETARLLQQAAE